MIQIFWIISNSILKISYACWLILYVVNLIISLSSLKTANQQFFDLLRPWTCVHVSVLGVLTLGSQELCQRKSSVIQAWFLYIFLPKERVFCTYCLDRMAQVSVRMALRDLHWFPAAGFFLLSQPHPRAILASAVACVVSSQWSSDAVVPDFLTERLWRAVVIKLPNQLQNSATIYDFFHSF